MEPATPEPFFALEPMELEIAFGAPRRQRRWSVALRGLLVLPQLLAVWFLGVAAGVLAVIGWFAALALGRLPRWIAVFERNVIAYSVRVNAYAFLLVDEYPPFTLGWFAPVDYPIAVQIGVSRLSRLRVLLRWLLTIPVWIVSAIAGQGLLLFTPVIWLITLIRGRPPQVVFSAAAAVIRYQARYYAYTSLVTDAYPRRLFGDDESGWVGGLVSKTEVQRRPDSLVPLSKGAKRLMVLIIVLGIAAPIGNVLLQRELRPGPPGRNPAVVAAEGRLELAGLNAIAEGRCNLRCMEAHERALGEAYLRFASSLSRISFPRPQRGPVFVVIHQARQVGQLLLAASKSKDGGGTLGIDRADPPIHRCSLLSIRRS